MLVIKREDFYWALGSPLRVMGAMRVRPPGEPTTQLTKVRENGEGVTQEVESDTFTSFHESPPQGSVLFLDNEAWELQNGLEQ